MTPFTTLCAVIKPREIFESAASRHFQKFLCTPQSINRLYQKKRMCFTHSLFLLEAKLSAEITDKYSRISRETIGIENCVERRHDRNIFADWVVVGHL